MALTFQDEFDTLKLQVQGHGGGWATSFDWDRYNSRSAHTIGEESQIYVDPTFAGTGPAALGLTPFVVEGGVLSIVASPTPAAVKGALWDYDYTSGVITTKGAFAQTYGYFEMRADLPEGKGFFPAFWLLPEDGSYDGEIDVMEFVNETNTIWNHIHYRPASGQGWDALGFKTDVPDLANGFHSFGVHWSPQAITWFVDGAEVASTATPAALNKPMYMLANFAVGGSWAGLPDATTPFPAALRIDYIRAYSLDDSPLTPRSAALAIDAGMESLIGTAGDDVLENDEGPNFMRGGGGNDLLSGGDFFDNMHGNVGMDTLHGGGSGDWVVGGQDGDLLNGDEGDDVVHGNLGADTCDGGAGADTMWGGQQDDILRGGAGSDWLSGDRGADLLTGGTGADTFYFFAEAGADRVTDFSALDGDRVMLAPGTAYSVGQVGADVHIATEGGGVLTLSGVQLSSLPAGWIFGA